MPDREATGDFGIEVPEADRLEQLQETAATPGADRDDEAPVFDAGTANPADVFEQHLEVPADDEER